LAVEECAERAGSPHVLEVDIHHEKSSGRPGPLSPYYGVEYHGESTWNHMDIPERRELKM